MHFDWMKIGWAVLIGAMILFLLPRARSMFRQSRRGTAEDWMGVILPILLVFGLVALMIHFVR